MTHRCHITHCLDVPEAQIRQFVLDDTTLVLIRWSGSWALFGKVIQVGNQWIVRGGEEYWVGTGFPSDYYGDRAEAVDQLMKLVKAYLELR